MAMGALFIMMAASAVIPAPGFADLILSGSAEAPKDIEVEQRADRMDVQFSSAKKSYGVNDPISFKVKSNRNAYVYLFQVDEAAEKATLLFPNSYESSNKVSANKMITIPSKDSVFRSDRAGTEHIVLVTTMKPLDIQTGKSVGVSFKEVQKSLVDDLTKDIRVEPGQKEDRVIKKLDVTIVGKK